MKQQYLAIAYPERAESLNEDIFRDYQVFLDHWDSLAEKIRRLYEGVVTQRRTSALMICGAQGSGKTLLAQKLVAGLNQAKATGSATFDAANLWHRITSGHNRDPRATEVATVNTNVLHIEDNDEWVAVATKARGNDPTRTQLIIADNAERGYFARGLLGISSGEHLALAKPEEAMTREAAERFVALTRGALRGCLFVFLTNSENFAQNFGAAVDKQHAGLVILEPLPSPSNADKERIVRANLNQLNSFSYWFCLDRAGPEAKVNVHRSITGQDTFPDAFRAVSDAIQGAQRVGRPANKCTLTLVVMYRGVAPPALSSVIGVTRENRSWCHNWFRIETFDGEWAVPIMGDSRSSRMVCSEWSLRVASLGDPFVHDLLGKGEHSKELLTALQERHGVGVQNVALDAYRSRVNAVVDKFATTDSSNEAFWSRGQARSGEYEARLSDIFSGYNTTSDGFLGYRPDVVISPYQVCSVLKSAAPTADAISRAIQRDAHVFEFTASQHAVPEDVINYLREKVPNYVRITESQ